MKTILFDLFECQPAESSKFHGGGEYIKAVFRNLTDKYWGHFHLIVFYDKDKYLDNWIKEIIYGKNIKEYFIKKVDDISGIFAKERVDIFYSGLPYYYKRDAIPENVRIKGTIH